MSFYGIADLTLSYYQWQARFSGLYSDDSATGMLLTHVARRLMRGTRWWPVQGKPVVPYHAPIGLLGGTPEEIPEIYVLGSPITHVGSHCPPTLLLQGADDIGIVTGARHLHSALHKAGVTSIYVEYPDTEHGFDLVCPQISPVAQAATYDLERFLALVI